MLLFNCTIPQKSFKEITLDDMYPILSQKEYDSLNKIIKKEEIEAFIESYWSKNQINSNRPSNELKEEYLTRLEYANKTFPDRPGWGRSDRKRIYLSFGPPTYIERKEFVDIPYKGVSTIKSIEIWLYSEPAKNYFVPLDGRGLYTGEKKFVFADRQGCGVYKILYSSEEIDDIDIGMYNRM